MPTRKHPAPLDVLLPPLQAGQAADLDGDADLDGVLFDGTDLSGVHADGASVVDCKLSACRLDEARLRRARMASCLLEDVSATALDMVDATWVDVVMRAGRLGAFVAHGADLMRVAFVGVRLDYVNLRGSTLTQVRLMNCRVGELDVGEAKVTGLQLEECVVEQLVLTGAHLAAVDLSGAQLHGLDGVGSLSGATISQDQLTRLAPALAAHLGVEVKHAP